MYTTMGIPAILNFIHEAELTCYDSVLKYSNTNASSSVSSNALLPCGGDDESFLPPTEVKSPMVLLELIPIAVRFQYRFYSTDDIAVKWARCEASHCHSRSPFPSNFVSAA